MLKFREMNNIFGGEKKKKKKMGVSMEKKYIWNFYVKINFKIQTCLFI